MKKWWAQKKEQKQRDVVNDVEAIIEFLGELKQDVKVLLPELEQLWELEKERKVAQPGLLQINLETQAEVLDKLLQRYEFFQNDIDINGLRMKQIAQEFLTKAQQAGLKDLVKECKEKPQWKLWW